MFDREQDSYVRLRKIFSERTSGIVAWVGAGVSQGAGVPGWVELSARLETAIEAKARSLAEEDARELLRNLSSARAESNLWIRLQRLRDGLGNASFVATVREALAPAETAEVPEVYRHLWKMNLSGMISLNLERLDQRAYSSVYPGRALNVFSGRDAGQSVHLLQSTSPFLACLHGTAPDRSTWVLTHSDLQRVRVGRGYRTFVDACLASRTIVLLGITADDNAVGGFLEALTRRGVDLGQHFWITSRKDAETDRWAEGSGLQVIRYSSENKHRELLELCEDLAKYRSSEEDAPPVVPEIEIHEGAVLRPPEQLVQVAAAEIRTELNARAKEILSEASAKSQEEYERFCNQYDEAIYRAWYIRPGGEDQILGYKIKDPIGKGAFGTVYEAVAEDGSRAAIKVLHERVRRERAMLDSFRRGVKSMQILASRGVLGMVPYKLASEIPTCVVMDLVEGPDLETAIASSFLQDWTQKLRVALDVARIIQSAHHLPERVLHRDIRPSNIMLEGFFTKPDDWKVVVLDFDLSWHLDAYGQTLVGAQAATGFLAPEQLSPQAGVSRRSAAVDSFGLGMTFYFMLSGRIPEFGEQARPGWEQKLVDEGRGNPCREWRSLPTRFARLILESTRQAQADRWDMFQIVGELERLNESLSSPGHVLSTELVAEEILARSILADRYRWEWERVRGSAELPSGARVELFGNDGKGELELKLEWSSSGLEERRKVGKWIPGALAAGAGALRHSGWKAVESEFQGGLAIEASCPSHLAAAQIGRLASGLDSAVSALSFS